MTIGPALPLSLDLPKSNQRPMLMLICLVVSDLFCLSAAGVIALFFKCLLAGLTNFHAYYYLIPYLLMFPLVYAALGLYSGIPLSGPQELRRLTMASVFVVAYLALITFSFRGTQTYITWTMLVATVIGIVIMPPIRVAVRLSLSNESWWGYPTIVFGDGQHSSLVIKKLLANLWLGLKPVAQLSNEQSFGMKAVPVPLINEQELVEVAKSFRRRAYVVIASSTESDGTYLALVEKHRELFSHILIVPEVWNLCSSWVIPKEVGGLLGLEIREPLTRPSRQWAKRVLDISICLLGAIILAPLLAVLVIAVRLDSPGPAFYPHRRIGRGGVDFYAWKFRSMVKDADVVLAEHLAADPELAAEWQSFHKLRFDPRVTRFGSFLRRSSLDELPQLWNVLRGEMSLVGPRPIVRDEIAKYGSRFEEYKRVSGGLTGLWQVSGRSETTYEERVNLDSFYVKNWSVWLDLCILFRTIGILVTRVGAC